MSNEEGRIPYLFTPIPQFLFHPDYFKDEKLFRILAWAFHRTAFESKTYLIYNQWISLTCGEFVFGRKKCSEDTRISEQSIRTVLNQLTNQQMLVKVTSKSTSKFSVYRWVWNSFPEIANQQKNRRLTAIQPQVNHKQEQELDKESKQGKTASFKDSAAAFFSKVALDEQLKVKLSDLPSEEQKAIIQLFTKRMKKKAITNPGGWLAQCIKKGWHKAQEETFFQISEEEEVANHIEANRALAKQVMQELESVSGVQVRLRGDFLELGKGKDKQWQIFFHESPGAFKEQLESVIRKLS